MYNAIQLLLKEYKGKKILVVGHSTAIVFLLTKWCEVSYIDGFKYNGNYIFDGNWNYCETFKLEFDDNELISIKNIKYGK